MDVKLVILLCVASVAFANDFYNYAPVGYNPYYSFGGYPVETQEEYEYYDHSYAHAPAAASYSLAHQNQVPFAAYNTRVVSPALHPTAAPLASNVHVTSAPVQAIQPTVVSTTPVPLTNVDVASHQQPQAAVPVVTTTIAPILSKSDQLGLTYPHTGIVPAVSTYGANSVIAASSLGNVKFQPVINPTLAAPVIYTATQNPLVAGHVVGSDISNYNTLNFPDFVVARSNVVPYPYINPNLNNIISSGGNHFVFSQGSDYSSLSNLIKSNVSSPIAYAGNPGVYVSTPNPLTQNVYVPLIPNQTVNNGNLYSSPVSKANVLLQSPNQIINPPYYQSPPNPLVQNAFSSGNSFASSLSQSQLFPSGNLISSAPISSTPANLIAAANPFNSFARVSQPVITTASPTNTPNVVSYSATTPRSLDGFVPVTSTYTSVKKQAVYAAPTVIPQSNLPSFYYNANPFLYNTNSNTLLQNSVVGPSVNNVNQGHFYTSVPITTLSPSVSHNGTPSPVIYYTTPTPTIPIPSTSNQEFTSQITTTPRPTIITTQKPSSSTTYVTNQSSKLTTAPIRTQSFNNYELNSGVQSTTTLSPYKLLNEMSKVSFSTVKPVRTEISNYVPSLVTKPTTTLVTNPTASSTTQSSTVKYPLKPHSTIGTSSTAQSSFFTQTPTAANIRQDAFTAALSRFSKPSTYKPSVTNNYVSSSSIYDKGIQSIYTTPATESTATYTTPSSFPTQKPTVSYNSVNRQDAFTAALSGFSKPSTYKPSVTNNYVSSSSIYDKGIQSIYKTPATESIATYTTPSSFPTQKPTVSYNSVNRQDAFTAALSGFSKPSTYKPTITNNYVSSSSIYDKGIQSIYTTPATVSTATYTTPSSFPTQKPTVSYNSVNRQDVFTAALSGFSKPSTYKPSVTNNYVSSSSIYDKGIQSIYKTPVTESTATYTTPSSFPTQKPTVSYNSVNRQDAFTAALSGFSKPSTYKPPITNNYISSSSIYNKGIQDTYTTPATISTVSYKAPSSFPTAKPTVSYNNINRQDAFTAALSGFSKPSTYKPSVTNNYVSSSSIYNKGSQSIYTTPATFPTTSYITQSSYPTQKPTVSYNNINRQDAFTAALSGFSKPSTYKPTITNNYVSSSSIYDKGIQSIYTTPATVSTATYTTPSSFPTQKPTVSYNNINRQDAFTAALSGFSKPSTYKPPVINNYVSSSSIYNKGSQSIYTTPATVSTAPYTTQSSFPTQKPTVSYNSVNRQDAFTAALSGFSKPSTYRPSVTNNYVSSSSVYNKGFNTYSTPATYSTTIKSPVTQATNIAFNKATLASNPYKFNSFASQVNSLYHSNLAKSKYTPISATINKSYNQFVPFVNIPASTGYAISSASSVQKTDPVAPNYQSGLNIIVQPPIISQTGNNIESSTLDYSSAVVNQSKPPPESFSTFVHSDTYLPPGLPAVSDIGSNGVVTYISEPVVTSTIATPLVVSTTPRTLPLSYESFVPVENVVANTNQVTVKPVVYTTTPVITKVDSSPSLTPAPYTAPLSAEYAQVSSENPLVYSAAPELTPVNYL